VRLLPGPTTDLDLDAVAELYAHPKPTPGRAHVRANVVASADGAATGPDGGTRALSSPTDRELLIVQRRAADVILVGAKTAVGDGYQPGPTPFAVVSTALEIDLDSALLTDPSTVLVTSRRAAPDRLRRARCEVVVLDADRVEPAAAVGALVARGLGAILVEGGPSWLGAVTAAGLLDELCLTTAPMLLAGPAPRVGHSPAATRIPLRLASLCTGEGFLFARYLRD